MNENANNGLSRRGFLGMAGIAGAAAALGIAGCAPNASESVKPDNEAENGTENDWLGTAPDIAESDIVETRETDLLIVGAGNGGMVAAATATDEGLDFIICERNDHVQKTRDWIGAVDTSQQKEADVHIDHLELINELARYASYKCDMNVWRVWADESADTMAYLDSVLSSVPEFGITASLDTVNFDKQTKYTPIIQHMYLQDPSNCLSSPEMKRNEALESYIASKGKQVTYKHTLVKLERESEGAGRVTGAIFETDNGYVRINGKKGVLLATGGYAGNPVMTEALAPIVSQCTTRANNTSSCDGSGIKAAMWIGAKKDQQPAPMLFARGLVAPGVNAGYEGEGMDAVFPGTVHQFNLGTQPFMKVDRNGKRFINESTPYEAVCFAAADHPGGVWCEIWDSNAEKDIERFATVGCSKVTAHLLASTGKTLEELNAEHIENGLVFKADTIDELADLLGFEGEAKTNFLAQVDRYNELFDMQSDEDYGKEAFRLSELRTPPFWGAWNGACYLTTVDGLKINADMQVLDQEGSVIDGLYAAGDCSGSLFADNYPEYMIGCACGRTLTFSRHVAKKIASE